MFKNKTRKHSQKEEEEEDKMKKRHEQSTASIPVHLVAGTSILQRLKDLSKIDEKDEGFVQVYFHKRKSCSLAFSCPHKESRKFNRTIHSHITKYITVFNLYTLLFLKYF